MPTNTSPFAKSNLTLLITAAKRHIKQLGAAGLKRFKLTDQQCLLLETVRETGPVCLSDLAKDLHLDHPTTSRLVHALEERAFLKVKLDPKHRRRVLIQLNEGNRPALDEIHAIAEDYRARLEVGLTDMEKEVLRTCLGKLVVNLDVMEKDLQWGRIRSTRKPSSAD